MTLSPGSNCILWVTAPTAASLSTSAPLPAHTAQRSGLFGKDAKSGRSIMLFSTTHMPMGNLPQFGFPIPRDLGHLTVAANGSAIWRPKVKPFSRFLPPFLALDCSVFLAWRCLRFFVLGYVTCFVNRPPIYQWHCISEHVDRNVYVLLPWRARLDTACCLTWRLWMESASFASLVSCYIFQYCFRRPSQRSIANWTHSRCDALARIV